MPVSPTYGLRADNEPLSRYLYVMVIEYASLSHRNTRPLRPKRRKVTLYLGLVFAPIIVSLHVGVGQYNRGRCDASGSH